MVTIVRRGNLLSISPWIKGLDKELTTKRRVQEDARTMSEQVLPLFWAPDVTGGLTYGGMFLRITAWLKQHGVAFEVDDQQKVLPEPELERLPELRPGQPEILAAIATSNRGLIEAPTGFGKSFLVRCLVGMYSKLRIVIVTKNAAICRQFHDTLHEAYPGLVMGRLYDTPQFYPNGVRVIISTTASLHKVDPDTIDLLLFDEAHNAAAPEISEILSTFNQAHLFGFTATPTGRLDGTDLITEAYFGPVICRIDWDEAVRAKVIAAVKVLMPQLQLPQIETKNLTMVQRDRTGYWRNMARNAALIEVANKVFAPNDQVIFYVERIEHGLYLRRLLPDMPFVHAGIAADRWDVFQKWGLVQPEERSRLMEVDAIGLARQFKAGKVRRVIATSVWKEGVDFPDLAGLVRFDGGYGSIPSVQIGGRLTRTGSDQRKTSAILVDCMDDFGHVYRARSLARQRAYQAKGWTIE